MTTTTDEMMQRQLDVAERALDTVEHRLYGCIGGEPKDGLRVQLEGEADELRAFIRDVRGALRCRRWNSST